MRGLYGGRIVHSVSGHGNNFAVSLQALHDAQLLFGADAREDRDGLELDREKFVRHCIDFVARENVSTDTGLAADGAGRGWIISRDHQDTYSRRSTFGHGGRNLRAQGVGEAE